jgi:hypothetical protein
MTGIPIGQADSINEIFYNPGVAAALECVFKKAQFQHGNESREYAEVARAYWTLRGEAEELFADTRLSSFVPSEVPADITPETSRNLSWSEEAVDILFRRVALGIGRAYGDFQQMAAIRAFDKRRGLFSSSHASSQVGEETG